MGTRRGTLHQCLLQRLLARQAMLAKPGDQLFSVVDVSKCPVTTEIERFQRLFRRLLGVETEILLEAPFWKRCAC
jgi:hypothetical protein